MVSSESGDKRAGGIFRKNKISPSPVLYALVHPKPAPIVSKSPSSIQQHAAIAASPLRSPLIRVGSLSDNYEEGDLDTSARGTPVRSLGASPQGSLERRAAPLSSNGEGVSTAGRPSIRFRRMHHADALSPILIDLEKEMPASFSDHEHGVIRRTSNDGSVGSIGSVGAMVTAIATAALDAADAEGEDGPFR